ncbi:MAG TPA: low affinity iron permease family protein [Jatrophihabitans sp.]|jgi:low affinity Fe/Cu permease
MSDNAPAGKDRQTGSELLHRMDRVLSQPLLALLVVAGDFGWVICTALVGFPSRVESIFQTLVAALTLAMVFVIQHTQSREQLATQRKLDEILRAIPHADNALIAFEDASDPELSSAHQTHRQLRQNAVAAVPDNEQPQ